MLSLGPSQARRRNMPSFEEIEELLNRLNGDPREHFPRGLTTRLYRRYEPPTIKALGDSEGAGTKPQTD
jgi:hypothetical protein